MVAYDWGWEDSETWLDTSAPFRADVVDSDDPRMIPQVHGALAQGYELAPDNPLWCFLPAIWPARARAWVRDARARHMMRSCEGRQPHQRLPWPAATYFEIEADTNALLTEYGLGPRPPGRVWLLRLPPGSGPLEEVLDAIVGSAYTPGLDTLSPDFVEHTRRELQRVFGTSC